MNIADRPLSLAVHLRRVDDLLKHNAVRYEWRQCSDCNCGLVAQAITGKTPSELDELINAEFSRSPYLDRTWTEIAGTLCPITGVPSSILFRQLYDAGMRFEDFSHLENLNNQDIIAKVNTLYFEWTTQERFFLPNKRTKTNIRMQRSRHSSLRAYLGAWAAMIEEHHAQMANAELYVKATVSPENPGSVPADLDAVETRPLVT